MLKIVETVVNLPAIGAPPRKSLGSLQRSPTDLLAGGSGLMECGAAYVVF